VNARKGLAKNGYASGSYLIRGPRKTMAIDRDGRTFFVRPEAFPARAGFFAQAFRRLCDARPYAEQEAGLAVDLDAAMPAFLRRRT
jgi:hypothetical protein